ncbi:alpha/beta hydrolase [Myroides sp. 1354]|uniref:alpha/beta hydrolase n=1 Tax=unclassified Myroides TaxID=2642485 RepID=UPI0025779AC6|nr:MULTISPECIES: alpha/beta hydrolase [unclassified Myroides]MDM1043909.1 alpha/beta hydrolase [Myroides sp. R163-1]MDM1054844.1 alpha/beta hydrolase [Myroides sp. 1354]MDM1068141.1 alpha/beta hydrolase [Myroides sp. 1372]
MIQQDISIELMQAINESPYNQLDYDYLLAHNPKQIRLEEQKIAETEEPLVIPQDLTVTDIEIPSRDSNRNIRLRTYRPKSQNNLPVLLYFHGGAFIYGTPEQYDFLFFELASALQILIVSVDYRLAPEHPFPAALHDGYDALRWLSKQAHTLGGNTDNLSIGGSSAGGTIAASLAQYALDLKEVTVRHQYLIYPPMDHRLQTPSMVLLGNAPMQSKEAATWMWYHYLGKNISTPLPYAVPALQGDLSQLPPATIVVAEYDPLKDEALQYGQRLQQAKVSTTIFEVKGATHVFDFFPTRMAREFWQTQISYLRTIFTR